MISKVYNKAEDFLSENKALNVNLHFSDDVTILNSNFNIGNKTVPNRLVCQAMEGCDGTEKGSPDTLTKRRY